MKLARISIGGVRNLSAFTAQFDRGVNWVLGDNGAGKTSVLESVALLCTSRSFRATETAPVIGAGLAELIISGQVETDEGLEVPVGLLRSAAGTTIAKLDGLQLKRSSDLARQLPSFVLDASAVARLFGPAAGRRALIDWGVFHVEPQFGALSRQWKAALAQRNVLIRTRQEDQLPFWDRQVSELGEAMDAARRAYLDQLGPELISAALRLGLETPQIQYRAGWDRSRTLQDVLQSVREQELHAGYTLYGPHRADLRLRSHLGPAKDTLSRGQLKALASALFLAQIKVSQAALGRAPIALIDDLFAELDLGRAAAILAELRLMKVQVFCAVLELPPALFDDGQDTILRLQRGTPVN